MIHESNKHFGWTPIDKIAKLHRIDPNTLESFAMRDQVRYGVVIARENKVNDRHIPELVRDYFEATDQY